MNESDKVNNSYYLGSNIWYLDEFITGKPSYSILSQTSDKNLNPRDDFQIQLFISGCGAVDISRFVVNIPNYLPEQGSIKSTFLNISDENIINGFAERNYTNQNDSTILYFVIDNRIYQFPTYKDDDPHIPMIGGEVFYKFANNNGWSAPITISFVIAKDAPTGDHQILINYFYKQFDTRYQDDQIITLHINNFYETQRFKQCVYLVTFLGGLAALISIWPWLSRRTNRTKSWLNKKTKLVRNVLYVKR